MNRYLKNIGAFIGGAAFVITLLGWVATAHANPYLPFQGGTGTSTIPAAGQVLIGNASGTYSPANIGAGSNVTITTSSGGLIIGATGGGSSTSSPNSFTVTGNATTSLSGNATTSSYIPYDNNEQYLNPGYASVGAAGSSTATTFQAAINAIALQSQANGQPGVTIHVNFNIPSSTFTAPLQLNENGFIVSIQCSAGVEIGYSGTGAAINWNNGNPTGHLASDDSGCIYMGHNTLIAAGQTNTATTTGILFGGSNGAVGIDFHDNSINGFGTDLDVATNTYMLKVQNNSISGGNGGQAGEIASLIQVNKASNSGEGIDLIGNNLADPGNNSSTNCVVFQDGSISNAVLSGGEVDDCTVYNGYSNGALMITLVHFEDSDFANYMPYIYIIGTSSQASYMDISDNLFEIDDTNSGTIPPELILHGQQVYASGNVIQNYGGQTIPLFMQHNLNNGTEVETVCGTGFYNGTLTKLIDNLSYTQSGNGQGCWTDISNSWPVGISQTSGNTASIYNGGMAVATFGSTGAWTIGSGANNSTVTIDNNLSVVSQGTFGTNVFINGTLNATSTITQAGVPVLTQANASGTSGNIAIFSGGHTVGNSSLSQSGGTTLINGTTPVLDGAGDYIGPNIFMSTTSTVDVGNFVQGGGVETFNTTTTVTGTQFCSGGLINIQGTTGAVTISVPSTTAISASVCGPSIWAGSFAQQYIVNNSTNTVYSGTTGANEIQEYAPGTPTSLSPGQEWFVTGQFENSSTVQGATSTGTNLVIKYLLEQTSTPLTVNGNQVTFTSASGTAIQATTGIFQNLYDNGATTTLCETDPSGIITPGNCVTTFNGSSGAVNYGVTGTGNVTTTIATSGGNSTTTVSLTGVIGAANGGTATTTALGTNAFNSTQIYGPGYGLGTSGTNLVVSSTFASSSAMFPLYATTTAQYGQNSVQTNNQKSISSISCFDGPGASTVTSTIMAWYNTTLASSGFQQVILPSLACGVGGNSTTTFTTSTLPINAFLWVEVTSTNATTLSNVTVYVNGLKQ